MLLSVHLQRKDYALLPRALLHTRDFGSILKSREFSAQSLSIGELLRTL